MSKVLSKVLFFAAGAVLTASEAAQVARLQTVFQNVGVRNGSSVADTKFGTKLESFDFLAGTAIPSAYSTDNEALVLTVPSAVNPDDFKVYPATLTIDASDVDVQTPAAVKAEVDPATGLAKLTNLTGDASVTWASSDTGKATVHATTGKITAVAAGETTITATLQAVASITGIAGAALTDIFTKAAHALVTGDAVNLLGVGGGTGFGSVGDTRYIIKLTADTFKLATSYANAVAGTAIDVTADATNASICKARVTATMVLTVQA